MLQHTIVHVAASYTTYVLYTVHVCVVHCNMHTCCMLLVAFRADRLTVLLTQQESHAVLVEAKRQDKRERKLHHVKLHIWRELDGSSFVCGPK